MFLLNMHRETNCSHNPAGPPREIEVFVPNPPPPPHPPKQLALLNSDFSRYARSSHGWLNPGLLQRKDMLRFSLNWADFMFQGVQAPMAPWVGAKSLGLPFLAVDEIQPDKADPWFPALVRASPAHPADGDRPCSPSSAPRSARPVLSGMWITRYQWKHHASWLPAEVIYLLEMSAGLFPAPPRPPFPSSSPVLT